MICFQLNMLNLDEREFRRMKHFDKSAFHSAVGLATLPNLRSLEVGGIRLSESFYKGIVVTAEHSQVR